MNTEHLNWHVETTVEKYRGGELRPYETLDFQGNLLLNEGIALLLDLLIGAGGTVFSNANARLAVGDSSTAAVASQTGLQAPTNKLYKAMDSTYPSRSSQTLTFRSTFSTSEGNFAWNEWTVCNTGSDSGTNLNRKVQSMGTKTSADSWVLTVSITVT